MYEQKSFSEKLKAFDVYRKLPREYLQPSFLGALFSVISITIMVLLFFSEFNKFLTINTTNEMLVDNQSNSNTVRIIFT